MPIIFNAIQRKPTFQPSQILHNVDSSEVGIAQLVKANGDILQAEKKGTLAGPDVFSPKWLHPEKAKQHRHFFCFIKEIYGNPFFMFVEEFDNATFGLQVFMLAKISQ